MAIESITASQTANAEKAKAESDESLAQKTAFEADDIARKNLAVANVAKQATTVVPDQIVASLQLAIEMMLKTIYGYQNPKNDTFNPGPMIDTMIVSLNSVVLQLQVIGTQPIPGIAQINTLLVALKAAAKANENITIPGNNPEVSNEIMNIIQDLLATTLSMCITIPLLTLKVVFDMFTDVIACFTQIMPYNNRLPIIPQRLAGAPMYSAVMPNIVDFVTKINGQMSDVAYGVIRKTTKAVQFAQIPIQPTDIMQPQQKAAAPSRT